MESKDTAAAGVLHGAALPKEQRLGPGGSRRKFARLAGCAANQLGMTGRKFETLHPMDSTTYFYDLLKIILPALIVAGAIYFLFKEFLEKEQQRRLIELRLESSKTTLPLRLQAYERIVLFLERISPNNILVRLNSAGISAPEFHRQLQQEIRAEYEHNLSQQLYLSADAWTMVREAKENVLTMVNRAFHGIQNPAQARGTELAKRILEGLMMDGAEPTAQALAVVKNEAAGLF